MNQMILDDYVRLEHDATDLAKIVNVNWCMGNTCNFACSYCPSGLHDGSVSWYEFQSVLNFCEQIIQHYKTTIYFEFTGGEITLWKHFPDLCRFLRANGCKVGFISNSSRTMRWWSDILPYVDHVCLSYHPEAGDKEHYQSVAALTSQHFRTHLNIMMLPDRFDEMFEFAQQLSTIKNVSMALQPLLVDFGETVFPYDEDQKHKLDNQYALIVKHVVHDKQFETYRGAMATVNSAGKRTVMAPQKFISQQRNSWQGWHCYAGLENIIVDMDGSVYRGWCKVGDSIGHVLHDKLNLPVEPIICTKARCHCNFDIMCTKEKILDPVVSTIQEH